MTTTDFAKSRISELTALSLRGLAFSTFRAGCAAFGQWAAQDAVQVFFHAKVPTKACCARDYWNAKETVPFSGRRCPQLDAWPLYACLLVVSLSQPQVCHKVGAVVP